jgi:hypothetical protein
VPRRSHQPQPVDGGADGRPQFVVEHDRYPLSTLDEIDHALVAGVAVGPQQQHLHANLHALRQVGGLLHVRTMSVLVVYRADRGALAFH